MKFRWFKYLLLFFLAVTVFWMALTGWQLQANTIENIRIYQGESHYVNLQIPFLYVRGDRHDVILFNGNPLPQKSSRVNTPISLEGQNLGQVKLEFSLFGWIPLRRITVNVLPEIKLVPGGHSIGIKLRAQGVSVVGFYYFDVNGKSLSPAREAGVKIGDSILKINGEDVDNAPGAARLLEKRGGRQVALLINRRGKMIKLSLRPLYSTADGAYRIGLYLRDSAAGVGTLTFYDPETRRYGALGHIILDSDTHQPINLSEGSIVKAKIINVKAAQKGQPGEKTGIFIDGSLGNIEKNSPYGIFGEITDLHKPESPYPDPLPMALSTQVETGPAEILTVIDGETIDSYAVVIEKISYQASPADKGIVIRVVDEKLLQSTGGIIQGMSGSPIIQNGKLVGAVTHVFINDPTRGYGIFIEWMFQEAEIFTNN
jgi:stage IV sporulation protein B